MERFASIRPKLITPRGVLYNSDCLDMMRSIPSETIDCVFADPPFNLGKEYNNGKSDLLAEHHYLDWCRLWITESIRLLKPGAAIFIYNLPRWAYQLAAYLEEQEMQFRHWIAISMKGTFPRGNKLYPRTMHCFISRKEFQKHSIAYACLSRLAGIAAKTSRITGGTGNI